MQRHRAQLRLVVPFALPVAVLVVLRATPALDVYFFNASTHLLVVAGIAAAALVVALDAARSAVRTSHAGPVWLALGCLVVGVSMLAHGLLTPGVLGTEVNAWVGRMPYVGITVSAVTLTLAGRARNHRTSRFAANHVIVVLVAPTALLVVVSGVLLIDPTALWGSRPLSVEDPVKTLVTLVDTVLLFRVGVVHWRRWRLGHDIAQYGLVLSAAMSAAAILALRFGDQFRLSWWDYHGYLLAGFAAGVYTVRVRARRSSASDRVLAQVFETDAMVHIVEGYPDALRALVKAVEVKDTYTHGHSERTALVAVQIGQQLGVDEDLLRILARGGYLHDVGKIAIPDDVLNKPGRLDPHERELIETHPRIGYELVAPQMSLAEALPAVLHHHERWDGTGYPESLAGVDIPLTARIVAVADVWDALTSDRAYRPGWEPSVALAHITAGAGSHFDPLVVRAFVALAAEWGYTAVDTAGDPSEAETAVETCHEALSNRV